MLFRSVSVGPAKAQETLRTALAMGADRAILVQSDDEVEPLAVAKIVKGIADEEQPGLIITGKQAIDDDSNQVGQMVAALLGRPQGTFANEVSVEGDAGVLEHLHPVGGVAPELLGGVEEGHQGEHEEGEDAHHHQKLDQREWLRLSANRSVMHVFHCLHIVSLREENPKLPLSIEAPL